MTIMTFDELAVHAYASGSVDAWMRLIDEAIAVGREYWVYRLWCIDPNLCLQDMKMVRSRIPVNAWNEARDYWANRPEWAYAIADQAKAVPA